MSEKGIPLQAHRIISLDLLSITCDNASNNDTMVKHLATLVENFPGAANQTRCFTHILNLVAKSILRQFDVAKKAADDSPPQRCLFPETTSFLRIAYNG